MKFERYLELNAYLEAWIVDYIEKDSWHTSPDALLSPSRSSNEVLDFVTKITHKFVPSLVTWELIADVENLLNERTSIYPFVVQLRAFINTGLSYEDVANTSLSLVSPLTIEYVSNDINVLGVLASDYQEFNKVWWFETIVILSRLSTVNIYNGIEDLRKTPYYDDLLTARIEAEKERVRAEYHEGKVK